MKDRNKRKLIIYVLVGVLMLTTVAYAALSTVLNVSGTVVKKGNLWNIYFTNPSSASIVGTATGSSINIQASSLNFQVSLYKPGDKVTYTVDIKNGGTIDAVLNSISLTGLDTAKSNSLNYTVTYSNGSTIKEGDTLNIGASRTIKITVEFDSSATSLPESDVNLTFGVTLIYGQTTSSSSTGTSGITSNNVIAGIYGESIQNGTPTPTIPVEIKSVGEKTKNLFNLTKDDFSKGTINGEGKLVKMTLKPNTVYTLSSNASKYDSSSTNIWFNGNSTNSNGVWENQPRSTTSDQNGEIYIVIRSVSINNIFENYWIQLEEGSTATSYEPYGYRIPITVSNGTETKTTNIYLKEPLRKIGEYADYLDLTNKKVVRNTKEIVFNGTESWQKHTNLNIYYINDTSIKHSDNISCYSDKYKGQVSGSGNSYGSGNMWIQSISSYPRIYISNDNYTTVDTFKTYLASSNVAGYFVLETPAEESVAVPEIPSLTGNVTYTIGTSIKPSSINYTTR